MGCSGVCGGRVCAVVCGHVEAVRVPRTTRQCAHDVLILLFVYPRALADVHVMTVLFTLL
jgi:hypothetical protein